MPDIQLRFHKDMLVLSAPIDAMLAQQGVDASLNRQYLNLMEPDCIRDALRLEVIAGAQCIVATTEDITQARLAHVRMDGDAARLAAAALEVANEVSPQHVLAEIGPCGLPLDPSSKASLNENRAQYADAARAFKGGRLDALFLNGFTSLEDLKCALAGAAQVSDWPVIASVTLGGADAQPVRPAVAHGGGNFSVADIDTGFGTDGFALLDEPSAPPVPAALRTCMDPSLWPEAIAVMEEFGASVVGFETAEPADRALAFAQAAVESTNLPVLAQLRITVPADEAAGNNLVPLEDITEYTPDTLVSAAVKLYGAGVQFLRATGLATPAYTGALAATVSGLDVKLDAGAAAPAAR